MELIPVGSKAYCAGHKGVVVAYYVAQRNFEFLGEHDTSTDLYGVIELDEQYKCEGPDGIICYIKHLTVHHSNLHGENERPWD